MAVGCAVKAGRKPNGKVTVKKQCHNCGEKRLKRIRTRRNKKEHKKSTLRMNYLAYGPKKEKAMRFFLDLDGQGGIFEIGRPFSL